MTPERYRIKVFPSPAGAAKPVPVNRIKGQVDLGDELEGFGLQGLKATEDDLLQLVAELGLDGDEADDLVQGLSGFYSSAKISKETLVVADAKKPVTEETAKLSTEKRSTKADKLQSRNEETVEGPISIKVDEGPATAK